MTADEGWFGQGSLLQRFMRSHMPWIAQSLDHAIKNLRYAGPGILSEGEQLQWEWREQLSPALDRGFAEARRLAEEHYDGATDSQVERDWVLLNHYYAIVLDLGLLAPAFLLVRFTLHKLLESDLSPVRTAAILALAYAGHAEDITDERDLVGAIKAKILNEIPFQMYCRMLPTLEAVFRSAPEASNVLLQDFVTRPKRIDFRQAETALFLSRLGLNDREVLEELLDWANDSWTEPLEREYQARCEMAFVRLIETDHSVRGYFLQKIRHEHMTAPSGEVQGWIRLLKAIDPHAAAPDVLPDLLALGEDTESALLRLIDSVDVVVKWAWEGYQQDMVRRWILARLQNDDEQVVYRTLQGIWSLPITDAQIRERILRIAESRNDRSDMSPRAPAVELIGMQGWTDDRSMKALSRAAQSRNFLVRDKAMTAIEKARKKGVRAAA